jgi:hypothetical protein
MKTTKKRFLPTVCTVLFCFFSLLTSSQAQIEVGVFTGFSNYQGDLADGAIIWRETQMSYGALIRYTPNRFWSVRASYIQGQIQASDYNSAQINLRKRGYRFKSTLNEFAAIGEFNFLGKDNNTPNDFSFMFNPYLFGGVGVVSTTGIPQAPGDCPIRHWF